MIRYAIHNLSADFVRVRSTRHFSMIQIPGRLVPSQREFAEPEPESASTQQRFRHGINRVDARECL
jgi:hypothetical protein